MSNPNDRRETAKDGTGSIECEVSRGHGFYSRLGKRIVDVVAAAVGLLLLSPFLLTIAAIAKLTSPGPVLYTQERVGKDGTRFRVVKFRTMEVNADQVGPGITASGDPRITRLGRWLRLLKLDELPQLWNVLRGEMSLVGPRPELPKYVAGYTEKQRKVLSVRPGITDMASILYRHEERVLGVQADPERAYRELILPHKLDLNLEYLRRMSLVHDLSLILRTLRSLFESGPQESI